MPSKPKEEIRVTVTISPVAPEEAARRLRALARLLLQAKPKTGPEGERPEDKPKE